MIVSEFITKFEERYPVTLAYNWDNVGLQLGSKNTEINNVLLSLDLTMDVVNEAISKNANLIVVHHPIIFVPIKKIDTDTYFGKMIEKILKSNICIYVAHTNFDISNEGMNKILADYLDLENQEIIKMETVSEGLGRYGTLQKSMTLFEFINHVKALFRLEYLKIITSKDLQYPVNSVAVLGGSGSELLKHPIIEKIDAYITGDITYHHALDALNKGLTVLDVGHNIEKIGIIFIQDVLRSFSGEYKVFVSEIDTNPYKII